MKGKVESAVHRKTGTGKFGDYHIYDIKIVGDDKTYNYMGKKNPQNSFVVGEEVEFTVEEKQNGQYTNYNIKPAQQGGFGGGFNNGARLELDRKVSALNNAVLMVTSGKVGAEKLKDTYDKFLSDYL